MFWNGQEVAAETNAQLILPNVQLQQAGVYYVQVSNETGSTNSNLAALAVEGALTDPGRGDASFNPGQGANGEVMALALQRDGKILLAGAFTEFDKAPRAGIARINPDGTLDPDFNPGIGVSGYVRALLLQPNGQIVAGGRFDKVDGQSRTNLCRFNPDGSLDSTFAVGSGPSSPVYALALQADGKILVGGAFESFDGEPLCRLLRLNPDGTVDRDFGNPCPDELVSSIAVQADGGIVIGGAFTLVGECSRIGIARLLPSGALDQGFNPGWGLGMIPAWIPEDGLVRCILPLSDGRLLIGGPFKRVNDEVRSGVTRLLADGAIDETFAAVQGFAVATDVPIYALARQADGKVLLGGQFNEVNGLTNSSLARLNQDGTLDSGFSRMGVNGTVNALAFLPDGSLVAGGNFTQAGGLHRNGIAAFQCGPSAPAELFTPLTPECTFVQTSSIPGGFYDTFHAGQDIVVQAQVRSPESVQFQWAKGGASIPGATNSSLRLQNVAACSNARHGRTDRQYANFESKWDERASL